MFVVYFFFTSIFQLLNEIFLLLYIYVADRLNKWIRCCLFSWIYDVFVCLSLGLASCFHPTWGVFYKTLHLGAKAKRRRLTECRDWSDLFGSRWFPQTVFLYSQGMCVCVQAVCDFFTSVSPSDGCSTKFQKNRLWLKWSGPCSHCKMFIVNSWS